MSWRRGVASALAASAILASGATAEPTDELDLWVPSLGIFSGTIGQNSGADIITGVQSVDSPPPAPQNQLLREPADGRDIHNEGHGTYLFRWVDGAWKVVHTQSASRPVRTAGAGG